MKKVIKLCIAWLGIAMISTSAMAEGRAFNLSLTPDIAVYDRDDTIEGVTLSVWGENKQTSLALGLVNGTVSQSEGVGLGFLNYADSYKGVQLGMINYAKNDSTGWGNGYFSLIMSCVNYTGSTMKGLCVGVVNYAGHLSGLQCGLINYVEDADGIQFGLINIIDKNKSWFEYTPGELAPVMIIVNWRY